MTGNSHSDDSDSWDTVHRESAYGELPTFHRTTSQMSTDARSTTGARLRGGRGAASSSSVTADATATLGPIAPSSDQYGPIDELSTTPSYRDESKQKLGRHGREAEKWAALLPKQPSKKPLAPGQYRSGLLGVVDFAKDNADLAPLIIYTALALFTRLWRIGKSDTVVWDEAHFGKFGAYYLNRTVRTMIPLSSRTQFYFDVHPPLGKMLVGLAGALTGFNGSFDYPSGATYPEFVPFRAMRILMALPGVAMVPLAWGTAFELGFTNRSRHLVTLMVLCDIAWMVISRFVLLDSMLLFFTFCVVYCLACFHNEQARPFSLDWWIWLSATGISIGCVMSVKWVGFFVTALVGIYTIEDLWDKFGDLSMPVYVRHWAARVLCLVVLPLSIYIACFKIHFMVLNRSGPGDAQMSSLFQAHLAGNDFANNPLEPVFGSKITLKNMGYGGGLLHSHVQTYPVGSQQQQVTCYHYRDTNNDWIITPTWDEPDLEPNGELRYLNNGDTVRLVHETTGRNLHSHAVVAPVTKLANEVSCYGNSTIGDSNDHWVIEAVDDMNRGKPSRFTRIHSLTTRLRIRHANSGCYLRAANAILPQWGFKQIEVSCDKENRPKDEHTYWNIESHWNERLPPGQTTLYRSPFFRDFWHLNVAMMTSNNALVPDADKEDIIASSPVDWPFLHLGMRMNGWGDGNPKYYLIGNPIVWWASSLSLIVFVGMVAWYAMRMQRKIYDFKPGEFERFLYIGKIGFGGWVLHYLPFLIMGRVTYLHHYLPTLWFACILCTLEFDHLIFASPRWSERTKTLAFGAIAGSIIAAFWLFRNAAFGFDGPIRDHQWLQWRSSWNIY